MFNLFAKDALVVPFEQLRMTDVESVGGKTASLGEMISQLPDGLGLPRIATTASAIRNVLISYVLLDSTFYSSPLGKTPARAVKWRA
jgi:pyruvate,water dikinase